MLIRICNINNQPYRLKMQQKIAKTLEKMSKEYSLSIIVTNHMTKKFTENDQKTRDNFLDSLKGKNLEPSLGLSWNSLICDRLILKSETSIISGNEAIHIIHVTNNIGETASFKVRFLLPLESIIISLQISPIGIQDNNDANIT
ncbi:DNA repair protein RAD51 [Cryptosporidium canis]|nr:DNA repair protein RAD51 [Cryptosporidium canis]